MNDLERARREEEERAQVLATEAATETKKAVAATMDALYDVTIRTEARELFRFLLLRKSYSKVVDSSPWDRAERERRNYLRHSGVEDVERQDA